MLLSLLYMALRVILRLAQAGDGRDREVGSSSFAGLPQFEFGGLPFVPISI